MELPENTTFVGEMHQKQKIYMEDYVFSYLKQIHKGNPDKEIGVALYGKKSVAENENYYLIYAAAKLDTVVREVKHLSQAQLQEVERIQKMLFPMYRFCGYCMVEEEVPQKIMLYEDDRIEAVSGYARFYEKNDLMLEQMLAGQEKGPSEAPENYDRYEAAKSRQQNRRDYYYPDGFDEGGQKGKEKEEIGQDSESSTGKSWWPVVICGVALFFLFTKGQGLVSQFLLTKWNDFYQNMKEAGTTIEAQVGQKAFDQQTVSAGEESTGNMTLTEVGAIVTDEGLGQVILEENKQQDSERIDFTDGEGMNEENGDSLLDLNGTRKADEEALQGDAMGEEPERMGGKQYADFEDLRDGQVDFTSDEDTQGSILKNDKSQMDGAQKQEADQSTGAQKQEADQSAKAQKQEADQSKGTQKQGINVPTTYVICKGDTLIGISLKHYGNMEKVKEICKLNNIDNPDNIQIGQKILLP